MNISPKRRRLTALEMRRNQMRKARADAPTIGESMPEATQVDVDLVFAGISPPAPAPRTYTAYPAAQAHFVYACPFGDCDGSYDLNDAVRELLRGGSTRTAGSLPCTGHRAQMGSRPCCGLAVAYTVAIRYAAEAGTSPGTA